MRTTTIALQQPDKITVSDDGQNCGQQHATTSNASKIQNKTKHSL
jgi:hypothetical protein